MVEIGGSIACTITLGDAVQKVTAVVKDLKGDRGGSFVTTR